MKLFTKGIFIATFICITSCSDDAQTADNEKQDPTIEETSSPVSEPLQDLKDPCELITKSDLESIDGFESSSEGKVNLISNDEWKQCDYFVDNKNLSVLLKRYNQGIIERKGIEESYRTALDKKDEVTTSEVENAPGDQAIYSFWKPNIPGSGSPHTYELKWRYGNHTEGMITITYKEEQNSDDVLKRFLAIAEKLD